MITVITRTYHFESGHYLPKVHDGHKCKRQHGHNYKMEVAVTGELNEVGFVIDFWDLDDVVQPLVQKVDHRNLNDIVGLENPTAEHIAAWFYQKINTVLRDYMDLGDSVQLVSVTIWETPECSAKVFEEEMVNHDRHRTRTSESHQSKAEVR